MKPGISTGCLYPESTEKAIELLLDNGFRLFEIFFNTFSELEPDYLDRLIRKLSRCDARVCAVHPFTSSYESFLLFSAYERRFLDGVDKYEMYFRTARRLGADYVILHGMRSDFSTIPDSEYFRRFGILSERGARFGVTLLQENVHIHKSNDPDFIRKMKASIPDCARFVCDTKQARMDGIDPAVMLEAMGDSLRHIHISDYSAEKHCLLPGQGDFRHEEFFRCLEDLGFDGNIMIEVYKNSYKNIGELKDSIEFLSRYLQNKGG